jgi:murein DD-endopeptidase MepM/ murein hydrolase activator NlpD
MVMKAGSEWWTRGVIALAVLHAALFLTLQARPGRIAPVLWMAGPISLVIVASMLLAAALLSSLRNRHTWSRRRAAWLAALFVLVMTTGAYRTYPSSYDDKPSRIDFRLPLDGPVTVAWGGADARVNHHVINPEERWGYDLLVTVGGLTHRGSTMALTDYHVYDRPVHAPAAGRVVDVHDGDPDAPPARADRVRQGGNRVVLEVATGQYLFILHLRAGTIRVAPGDDVREGEIVGHVGNSGNSSEPHVHVHLQDTREPGRGEGIPLYFSHYVLLDRGQRIRRGLPQGGMRGGRYVGDTIARAAE